MPVDKQQHARILIIEDGPTMAHDIQDLLVEAGFEIAGLAGKLEKALALIESGACDAAIVDSNLAGVSASPAASALAARGLMALVGPTVRSSARLLLGEEPTSSRSRGHRNEGQLDTTPRRNGNDRRIKSRARRRIPFAVTTTKRAHF